jgi:hypothetical protein
MRAEAGRDRPGPYVSTLILKETVRVDVFRGHRGFYAPDPDETPVVEDLIVNNGRIYLARRIAGGDTQTAPGSAMAYMAVGTATAAAALTDTTLPGEIKRKGLAVNSALVNNVYTAVSTYGGAAESIQSIAITEAGVFNHANSGQGTMMQRVTFAAVTLADSDLLRITLETNVGSNVI